MKTNKHQTLLFIKNKYSVRAKDITNQFSYSAGTARSYLSYLSRQGLLERVRTGHILTDKGQARLQYFNVVGCNSFDCPLCIQKKNGHFTCTQCGHQINSKKTIITPKQDFFLIVKNAGVYCPVCQKLIFSERQAEFLGIRRKENKK